MFWNKKEKKEGLPDLPPRPGRADLPAIKPQDSKIPEVQIEEMPEEFASPMNRSLPELPNSQMESRPSGPPALPTMHKMPQSIEMEEEIIHPAIETQEKMPSGPIFVKLDKFKSAKASLEKIEEKLNEIDEVLKKTREIKEKEEQELEFWEKELQNLKTRITKVTEDIFEKVE